MTNVAEICRFLEAFAPTSLSEDWDNVGLLVGRSEKRVERVMTCLTVTPSSADEAVDKNADLVVTHHPIPFRPLKTITDDSVTGRLLLNLIESGVAVYSPHTAFDSAMEGINQGLAMRIGVVNPRPLIPAVGESDVVGVGRFGRLEKPVSLEDLADRVKSRLSLPRMRIVGAADKTIETMAVACGSAGEFLSQARGIGCDAFLTGEASFHTCLEAEATEVALLLTGHFASERFGLELLAKRLADEFAGIDVWPSDDEADPLRWA